MEWRYPRWAQKTVYKDKFRLTEYFA